MGRSITPKYRVNYRDQSGWHSALWRGKATNGHAEAWRKTMNQSFQHNGVNFHLTQSMGYELHVSHVEVINQRSGRVVARATMPMFEVT